jgi:hypothetical protein
VPPPVITLRPEDIPEPNAADQQVVLPPEVTIRLGQSIVAWANYVALVAARCGERPVPVR